MVIQDIWVQFPLGKSVIERSSELLLCQELPIDFCVENDVAAWDLEDL